MSDSFRLNNLQQTLNMKAIINKLKYSALLFTTMLATASCTSNFEDWNQKEGEPNDEQIMEGNYKLWAFFPQMLNYAYPAQENAYQMGQNLIGDPYGRYLSISNPGFQANFSIFNAPDGWVDSPFKDVNEKVIGAWVQIGKMTEKKGHIFALAQIVRVTGMQRLADLQGPIPYTQAGSGALVVSYDSQEAAYKAMVADLDAAVEVLSNFTEEDKMMERFDQVYEGNISNWIRYANSLKLRMALRVVYADEALAKKWAEEAVKHPGGLLEDNTQNATNSFPQNPVWTMTTGWGDSRACADIIAYMNGYEDPRIGKYFTPNTAENIVVEGKDTYLGIRTGVDLNQYTTDRIKNYSSTTYKRNEPTLWMPAAEIAFLRAEGALRGWDMGGTAQEFYEKGIQLSFDQWGAGSSAEYIKNSTLKPAGIVDPTKGMAADPISSITIAWNEADEFEVKLERLITQKWIAMYPLGTEAWSDNRRTGYPRFFPVLVNASDEPELSTRLASRIPFPPRERENNKTNYDEAVKLLGGPDKYGTRLWWDQKPNKPNF